MPRASVDCFGVPNEMPDCVTPCCGMGKHFLIQMAVQVQSLPYPDQTKLLDLCPKLSLIVLQVLGGCVLL